MNSVEYLIKVTSVVNVLGKISRGEFVPLDERVKAFNEAIELLKHDSMIQARKNENDI